jgi:lipoate-protein ligase A
MSEHAVRAWPERPSERETPGPAWRYLTGDGTGAAEGLALDEALTIGQGRHGEGLPPVLRLYTYRDHCALVGRYQHLDAEIDREACAARGAAWNRRPTGGGAIVMGAGQLGVAVAVPAPAGERPRDLMARFAGGILAGLAGLSVDAELTGKNDLSVGGRKIAGLGLYLDPGGGLLFHASVLADLDVPNMLSLLRIPAAKLADKAIAAVSERITTVTRETGRAWAGVELRDVIAGGFTEALGIDLVPASASSAEEARAQRLVVERYATEAWWSERSPRDDATGTAACKTPEGLVRCYLALNGPTVKSAMFAGDFSVPPPALVRFEAALRWARLDHPTVARLAEEACADGTGLGVEPDVLVACVLEAGRRAQAVAAPVRDAGSCYFPERCPA